MIHKEKTWSISRDDPVEHVLTVFNDKEARPYEYYYECQGCGGRMYCLNNEGLEMFLLDHDECKDEIHQI